MIATPVLESLLLDLHIEISPSIRIRHSRLFKPTIHRVVQVDPIRKLAEQFWAQFERSRDTMLFTLPIGEYILSGRIPNFIFFVILFSIKRREPQSGAIRTGIICLPSSLGFTSTDPVLSAADLSCALLERD